MGKRCFDISHLEEHSRVFSFIFVDPFETYGNITSAHQIVKDFDLPLVVCQLKISVIGFSFIESIMGQLILKKCIDSKW